MVVAVVIEMVCFRVVVIRGGHYVISNYTYNMQQRQHQEHSAVAASSDL